MFGKSIAQFLAGLGMTLGLIVVLSVPESYGAGVSLLLDAAPTGIGARVNKRVKSLLELRQERVILQNLDYSCGAAALATVLRHGFGLDTTERELISLIFVFGQTPKSGIKKYFKRQGFTLLDLKRAARAKGYPSVGYKEMEISDLVEVLSVDRLPVLVPIRPLGYNHFVVLKGIYGSRVYMADPAFGNKSMKIHQFLDSWIDGIGFIIQPKPELAKKDLGIEITDTNELAAISAAGVAPGWASAKRARGPEIASDKELDVVSAGALVAGADTVPGEGSPSESLLNFEPTGESVEYWRVQRFILDPEAPQVFTNFLPTITNTDFVNIITFFEVQNFGGSLQLGKPAGNFLDFSQTVGVAQ